jgi:hypothetical protein
MKPVAPMPQKPSPSTLITCSAILTVCLALCGGVVTLSRNPAFVMATKSGTYSKRTAASRRQIYSQDFLIISYSIGNNSYTRKTSILDQNQRHIPVYYSTRFPALAWVGAKTNPMIYYSITFAVLAGCVFFFSLYDFTKRRAAFAESLQKTNKKKA